jgi:hypothetical protein
MALDFPSSPSNGQIFVDSGSGNRYVYEAATTKWKSIQNAGVVIAYSFDKANAAFYTANAAFGVANAALPNVSNTVFEGNLRITGTLSIGTNTVVITDNSISAQSIIVAGSPIPSGVTSNLAFDTANAAFASANNVGPQIAPAFNTANAAYGAANNVGPQIAPAFNTANAAYGAANNVGPQIAPAFITANAAFASVNSNWTVTNTAYGVANAAFAKANTVSGQTIASGTTMTFQQTTAPTGFTKVTTYNDYAMRIVSGSVANKTNGVAFTTAFASQTPSGSVSTSVSGSVGSTTLSTSQIPSHSHTASTSAIEVTTLGGPIQYSPEGSFSYTTGSVTVDAAGGGGSHNHSFSGSASSTFTGSAINMAVNYVDFILATAN